MSTIQWRLPVLLEEIGGEVKGVVIDAVTVAFVLDEKT